jgi:hypothetical protein
MQLKYLIIVESYLLYVPFKVIQESPKIVKQFFAAVFDTGSLQMILHVTRAILDG